MNDFSRPLSNAERVRRFHVAIGDRLPDRPSLPPADTLRLRRTLVSEEYRETMHVLDQAIALQESDDAGPGERTAALVALAHELVDLLYVTYGSLAACGVEADELFAEVHHANMQKSAGPRRADGKQMKPPGWQPANVEAVLARQRAAADGE